MSRQWLSLRLGLVSLLVVGGLLLAREPLARALLPIVRTAAQIVALDFVVSDVELAQAGASRVLLAHADLAAPVLVGGEWVQPFRSTGAAAEYRVTVSVTGLFAYLAVYATLLLGWPTRGCEAFARLVLSAPVVVALLLIDAPFTIAAELWNLLYLQHPPTQASRLMVVSRFMMGGGGFLVAGCSAAAVISAARRIVRPPHPPAIISTEADDARTWNERRRIAAGSRR